MFKRAEPALLSTKKTREPEFLDEMDRVVPWNALVQIVQPHSPQANTVRPPFSIVTMLRIHYLQQWFGLRDPAMEVRQKNLWVSCGSGSLPSTWYRESSVMREVRNP